VRPGRDTCESRLASTTHRHAATSAWNDLVGRFAPYVAGVAGAYRLPDAEAEELFHDVFTHAWIRADDFSDDDLMRDWIVSVTDRLAARSRRSLRTAAEPATDLLERLHSALVASETIRLLPTTQREVAQRYAEGARVEEIASELGMEPTMVSEHVRRARRRVRARLGTVRRSGESHAFDE
jgi:RNA polymerase sigma factor (sigma-70 family)